MLLTTRFANTFRRHFGSSAALALGAAAGLAVASGPALAQDCKLGVQATPNILYAGQSAAVNVFAQFPPDIYAFASAQFDVQATQPQWTFASSGAILGNSVVGMNVGQPHTPQTGTVADPSNPFRVWGGVLTPTTNVPALIQIAANPAAISVYPSKLTSSSVPGVALGGSDWVMVNPLRAGQWRAAPGRGTRAGVVDDVIVDGRIITGENPDSAILIGLLLPAVQSARESAMAVKFEGRPTSLTASVQVRDGAGAGRPMESLAINFTKVNWATSRVPMYALKANMGGTDDGAARYAVYRGGTRIAAGDVEAGSPALWVDRMPEGFAARVAQASREYGRYQLQDVYVTSYSVSASGAGARVVLPGGRTVIADRVEVRRGRAGNINNLKQIGLGLHTFEAAGVQSMAITPAQPR